MSEEKRKVQKTPRSVSQEVRQPTFAEIAPQVFEVTGPMQVSYRGVLNKAVKAKDPLRPIFEALTNAIEAIEQLKPRGGGRITIRVRREETLAPDLPGEVKEIEIEDNGRGFTDEDYNRFLTLHDASKGKSNKGTGRLQYLLFFEETEIVSHYRQDGQTYLRTFVASKREDFLKANAIARGAAPRQVEEREPGTVLVFRGVLPPVNVAKYLRALTPELLKKRILEQYLVKFSELKEKTPQITIEADGSDAPATISYRDVPKPSCRGAIVAPRREVFCTEGGRLKLKETGENERLRVTAFALDEDDASENKIEFVCKGEAVAARDLGLLKKREPLHGKRYAVYLSGEYVDENVDDTRGSLNLRTIKEIKEDYKGDASFYQYETESFLVMDDVLAKAREYCLAKFPELNEAENRLRERLKALQRIYLFSDQTLEALFKKISVTESDAEILRKIYRFDSQNDANFDRKIEKMFQEVSALDPSDSKYPQKLNQLSAQITQKIPLQNRASLAKYVFRRTIVLKAFELALHNKLRSQGEVKKTSEGLLHDIIFRRKSSNPFNSDLWLLNEDFIYFQGTSDLPFTQIKIDGRRVFKENLPAEEIEKLHAYGKKRETRRPDILLFPEEGKCVIVELKHPDVDVTEHLGQINKYAAFIKNYSVDDIRFRQFYGFLIGENFLWDDIQDEDSDFVISYCYDMAFRPAKRVIGRNGRENGELYTEILRYSSILKRAQTRHALFNRILMGEANGQIED